MTNGQTAMCMYRGRTDLSATCNIRSDGGEPWTAWTGSTLCFDYDAFAGHKLHTNTHIHTRLSTYTHIRSSLPTRKNVHEQVLRHFMGFWHDWVGWEKRPWETRFRSRHHFLYIFVATSLCGIPCNDMKFCEQQHAVNEMKSVLLLKPPRPLAPSFQLHG